MSEVNQVKERYVTRRLLHALSILPIISVACLMQLATLYLLTARKALRISCLYSNGFSLMKALSLALR